MISVIFEIMKKDVTLYKYYRREQYENLHNLDKNRQRIVNNRKLNKSQKKVFLMQYTHEKLKVITHIFK